MLQRLGKYEILRPLGHGAMGEVFLASDTVLGRQVAIKTILPALLQGDNAEQRFRLEAVAAGKLNHPNIVTVFDFDRQGDFHYLVMEWVKGEDLEDLLQTNSLSQGQCLEILAQVCDGLACAHRNGIIHRDIKPSNVRVLQEGERLWAKIMDFGIARGHESGMTATGILMGTVNYMAPEYIRTGKTSPQSDLFAVGVMLHECLTGKRLFESDSTTTSFFKIVTDPIPVLDTAVIRGISPQIAAVLCRALAKNPEARFADGDAFAKALRACKDPDWGGFPGEEGVPPDRDSSVRGLRPPSKNFVAVAGIMALVGTGVLLRSILIKRQLTATAAKVQAFTQPPPDRPLPMPGAPSPSFNAAKAPQKIPSPVPVEAAPPLAQEKTADAPLRSPEISKPNRPALEDGPSERVAIAMALMEEDPGEAVQLLRSLAASHPGDAQIQGSLLAAIYHTRNAVEFERAYFDAKSSGLRMAALLKVPSFKAAIQEETRLHRNRSLYKVLPGELLTRMLNGLAPAPGPEPPR